METRFAARRWNRKLSVTSSCWNFRTFKGRLPHNSRTLDLRKAVSIHTARVDLCHIFVFWARFPRPASGVTSLPVGGLAFNPFLKVGLAQRRVRERTQLYWGASQTCGLRTSALAGPEGRRVVHVLPVLGKGAATATKVAFTKYEVWFRKSNGGGERRQCFVRN